jgi:hypothetical protein
MQRSLSGRIFRWQNQEGRGRGPRRRLGLVKEILGLLPFLNSLDFFSCPRARSVVVLSGVSNFSRSDFSRALPHLRRGSTSVLLTMLLAVSHTAVNMARYSAFLGRKVEVQYRAGDILLPASGTFVADSGRSIFLEQNFEARGQHRHFRWEIPYQYLVKIEEMPDSGATANSAATRVSSAPAPESSASKPSEEPKSAATAAGVGGAPTILPFSHHHKTA